MVVQALNDAGFPEEALPSRIEADRKTRNIPDPSWKTELRSDEIDASVIVHFLRTRYSTGHPGGLLLIWHPATRWLYVRSTGPRKSKESDFDRWIDKTLSNGATRLARLRAIRYQSTSSESKGPRRRDDLPIVCVRDLPSRLILINWKASEDLYEPNLMDWRIEPVVYYENNTVAGGPREFDLSLLPTKQLPDHFIANVVDGYNFQDFLFSLGRRGERYMVTQPRASVPKRLGILGNVGRRWRALLRTPKFGSGKGEPGPFESPRRRKPRSS